MIKKIIIIFTLCLCGYLAQAQSFTNVTATLTDSSAQIWSNATIIVSLRPIPNNPGVPLNSGHPITDSPQTITADGTGTFTVTVDDTSKVTPSGSLWTFTMCPNATVAVCSTISLPVTGVSQNLSASLSSALVTPKVAAAPSINRAYSDAEASGGFGGIYWNTTTNNIKGCPLAFCGPTGWAAIGGGALTGQYLVINVQQFGATGNGSTDDTTSINNAINTCPQSSPTVGCVIYFPAGQYKITSTLQVGLLKSIHFLGDGTVGTTGGASTILSNGAIWDVTIGSGSSPDTNGFQADNIAFKDVTGNALGAFDFLAVRDFALTNINCFQFFVGACVELDGSSNFTQFGTLTNIYSWQTKYGIQSNKKVASIYVVGGEFNCQNNGSTDIISNSVAIDFGFTNQGNSAGAGTVSESMVETQAQNCQYGVAIWNGGGNRIFGKAVEETINARPSGSIGVLIDGDTPSLANGNYLEGVQITKAGIGIQLKPNATNTTIIAPIFNGTNGVDLVADTGAYSSTRFITNKRLTGWTTNITDIARSGNTVTAHTTVNSDIGDIGTMNSVLITVFNVTGGSTNFNGQFLANVTTNDGTNQSTLTWSQTGPNESGTIFAGTSCGGSQSCVSMQSTLQTAGVGIVEVTGDNTTQNIVLQVPTVPNFENLPTCLTSSTVNIVWDGIFTDICEANIGLLHLSNGPTVNYNGTTTGFYSPQPTIYVGGNGTVNTNGTTVTWVSGTIFNAAWTGSIIINNVSYTISSVNATNQTMVIGSTAGVQNGVNYNTSGVVSVPACTNPFGGVCTSSDDKGYLFANNTNGTSVCLPNPGKANGYPAGYTWNLSFNPGTGVGKVVIAPPGVAANGSITCAGTVGTTLDGTTTAKTLTIGQGYKLYTDGNNWKTEPGNPQVPADQIIQGRSTNPANFNAGDFGGGGAGANNGGSANLIGGNSNSSGGVGGAATVAPGTDSVSGANGPLGIFQNLNGGIGLGSKKIGRA